MSKQQQDNYEAMIKSEMSKEERRGVDRWFLYYCRWYKDICESVGIDFDKKNN